MSAEKSKEILNLARNDEKSAFRMLFDTYYLSLVYFANKIVQDEYCAEDIVQESLSNFWMKNRFADVTEVLGGYLFEMVKNNAFNYVKAQNRKHEILSSVYEEYRRKAFLNPEDAEEYSKLYQAIELLPPDRRKVFKLVYIDGYRYQEVAEKLGISINTVQTQLSRSLQFLREKLLDSLEYKKSISIRKLNDMIMCFVSYPL